MLGQLDIRNRLAEFQEGREDLLGRIAWSQIRDVNDFILLLENIKDRLFKGDLNVLPTLKVIMIRASRCGYKCLKHK